VPRTQGLEFEEVIRQTTDGDWREVSDEDSNKEWGMRTEEVRRSRNEELLAGLGFLSGAVGGPIPIPEFPNAKPNGT